MADGDDCIAVAASKSTSDDPFVGSLYFIVVVVVFVLLCVFALIVVKKRMIRGTPEEKEEPIEPFSPMKEEPEDLYSGFGAQDGETTHDLYIGIDEVDVADAGYVRTSVADLSASFSTN